MGDSARDDVFESFIWLRCVCGVMKLLRCRRDSRLSPPNGGVVESALE